MPQESTVMCDTSHLIDNNSGPRKWYHAFRINSPASSSPNENAENPSGTLSTLNGVTIPVCLSMFSSLLFLRVGYIIGNAGLIYSLLQLIVAYSILVCTCCSISAIATNGSVKGGGVYFMISRTLGPQLGGSVGILFYLANVVAGSLYASGFAETLIANFGPDGRYANDVSTPIPEGSWCTFGYASCVLFFCLIISLIGAKAFSKATILFMLLLLVAILTVGISFTDNSHIVEQFNETTFANCTVNCTYTTYNTSFYGLSYDRGLHISNQLQSNLYGTFDRDCEVRTAPVSFFVVFGVLFAGVTGIMAGANVSGELKNPSTSIPSGTFTAMAISFIVYNFIFFLTAMTTDKALLQRDCLYMIGIGIGHYGGYIVMLGALLVTLCSCLNCLIGASRVVEALVSDTMFGQFAESIFGQYKMGSNPILAVILTFSLMMCCLLIGSLNKIAQLSSVLFLLSYSTVNMACLFLEWASAPNFRPKFKRYNILTCSIGVLGCLGAMFVISIMYSAICITVCFLFIVLFNFTSQPRHEEWGSIGQALIFHQVRKYLLLMDVRKDHVKFWRPQMLLLIDDPKKNCALIEFINSMKKSGLYVVGHVHIGDFEQVEGKDPSVTELPHWQSLIDHLKVKAFPEITVARSAREGILQLARISGLGAMKPNTVILGFGDEGYDQFNCLADKQSKYYSEPLNELFKKCDAPEIKFQPKEKNLELMKTVEDMIKLEKNVCLTRNFHLITKENKQYVDVWLVHFFEKPNEIVSDPNNSFAMQLSTILTMTSEWKNFKLRVFVRIMQEEERAGIISHLEKILKENRIPASVVTINFRRIYSIVQECGALPTCESDSSLALSKIPNNYMQEINETIKLQSQDTAVIFLRLSTPTFQNNQERLRMYELLKLQSDNLPPVIYVHGIKSVVSISV